MIHPLMSRGTASIALVCIARTALGLTLPAHRTLPPNDFEPEETLDKRDFYPNQLWNANGPDAKDIRQKAWMDCWWKAAEAAIVHVSPAWIQHLFVDPTTYRPYTEFGNPQPQADWPLVQLWNPNDLTQTAFHQASIAKRSQTEDKGMNGYFWPDALSQALIDLAKTTEVPGVDPWAEKISDRSYWFESPLSILTGYPGNSRLITEYANDDELFNHFLWCNNTPVMFNVNQSVPIDAEIQFSPNHVYPVTAAWYGQSGEKWVGVRNVWGRYEWYKFEDVKKNALRVYFLRDWNTLDPTAQRRSLPDIEEQATPQSDTDVTSIPDSETS